MQKSKREFRISSVDHGISLSQSVSFCLACSFAAFMYMHVEGRWHRELWFEGEDRFAIEDASACKPSLVNRLINLTRWMLRMIDLRDRRQSKS
jgi:hypothetical protein